MTGWTAVTESDPAASAAAPAALDLDAAFEDALLLEDKFFQQGWQAGVVDGARRGGEEGREFGWVLAHWPTGPQGHCTRAHGMPSQRSVCEVFVEKVIRKLLLLSDA